VGAQVAEADGPLLLRQCSSGVHYQHRKEQGSTFDALDAKFAFFYSPDWLYLQAVHVEGRLNTATDKLSRDNLSLFCHQVPDALPSPTPNPKELVELLLIQRPD